MNVIRVVSMMLMITGCFLLDSALGGEKVLPQKIFATAGDPAKAQGARVPGGAREYVADGKMTGGFALAAFPVRYGISSLLTFIVNQEGIIYQKDLGPKTVVLGNRMTVFDPDESWTKGQQNLKI
jgi:hypothetical protein